MSSHTNVFGVLMLVTIIITAAAVVADTSSIKPKLPVDTYTLDVSGLDETSYKEFIEMLRRVLTNNKDPPVLPPETKPPQYFDLKLTADSKETTVRFEKYNLYVVGYQAQTPQKKWFEFGKTTDKKHKIDGSVFLGYGGSYPDLKRAANRSVTEVSLTQSAFYDAVFTLARSTDPKDSTVNDNQKRARALILVAQMVSEACRFVDISDYLASNIFSSPTYLKEWMYRDLETNWDKFSKYVLFPQTFQPPTIDGKVIDSVAELRKKLGVLLNITKSVKQPGKIDDDVDDELPNIIDVQAQLQDAESAGLEA